MAIARSSPGTVSEMLVLIIQFVKYFDFNSLEINEPRREAFFLIFRITTRQRVVFDSMTIDAETSRLRL